MSLILDSFCTKTLSVSELIPFVPFAYQFHKLTPVSGIDVSRSEEIGRCAPAEATVPQIATCTGHSLKDVEAAFLNSGQVHDRPKGVPPSRRFRLHAVCPEHRTGFGRLQKIKQGSASFWFLGCSTETTRKDDVALQFGWQPSNEFETRHQEN
jgi:hypothetical protein